MDKAHYRDAIVNRKATVHLLVHENSGGFTAYASRFLRRLARGARELGSDPTDYTQSWTARAFVPYYAQRISTDIVVHTARGLLKGIDKFRRERLLRAGVRSA